VAQAPGALVVGLRGLSGGRVGRGEGDDHA
jgi:hypothetical protein